MRQEIIDRMGVVTDEERAILQSETLDKSIYTDGGGFTIDNDKMLGKGKLIALRPHTRFIDFPAHNHNYIEMMYVCAGSVTHEIGGKEITLRRGELLLMSRGTYHAIRRAGQDDVAVNLIVLPAFFDTAFEMIDHDNILSQFISQNLLGVGGQISHLHFRVAQIVPIQNLIENLVVDILGRQPNRRSICSITMGLLFLQLLNHTQLLDLGQAPDHDTLLTIAILREIEENYRAASLTALAARHNGTVYALSRLIKDATGKTYTELLQEKRFAKAVQLLGATSLSVASISAYVGYENTSYFHRRFQQRYGMSPAAYRAGSVANKDASFPE